VGAQTPAVLAAQGCERQFEEQGVADEGPQIQLVPLEGVRVLVQVDLEMAAVAGVTPMADVTPMAGVTPMVAMTPMAGMTLMAGMVGMTGRAVRLAGTTASPVTQATIVGAAPAAVVAGPAAVVARPAALVARPAAVVARPAALVARPAAPVARPAAPVGRPAALVGLLFFLPGPVQLADMAAQFPAQRP
jgi:hypothetical protein